MEDYKRGSHTVWDCKYHLVWTTKYRYSFLPGMWASDAANCSGNSRSQEMVIYAGSINRDHVHMLIGIPPQISVSRAVQYLKGKSSHKLLSELRTAKAVWGQHLWGRGYWVSTSGNVTDESGNGISRTKAPGAR